MVAQWYCFKGKIGKLFEESTCSAGYEQVITPHIGNKELYVCSGHYEKYGEDHLTYKNPDPNEEFYLKLTNCPHHCESLSRPRSYRDLPLRYAEFVLYEMSSLENCMV